jgi:two-component system, cell cycle response regulator DivK
MSKTILIVEDYVDARTMMKFLLQGYGYEIIEAADGKEGIEVAKQYHPNLILMDMSMPVMDGLEATRIIRKMDGFSKIPIIAVTAYGNSYYRQAMEAGCDDLINKPLDFKHLERLLKQYLPH